MKLSFGGGCGLNGLNPAVLSATATTITVNVNSGAFTGCVTGTESYDGTDGATGYVQTFEHGVKTRTAAIYMLPNLPSYGLFIPQGRFPAEYDACDSADWGKYNPNVYQADTPVISAVQAFQASP